MRVRVCVCIQFICGGQKGQETIWADGRDAMQSPLSSTPIMRKRGGPELIRPQYRERTAVESRPEAPFYPSSQQHLCLRSLLISQLAARSASMDS